MNFLKRISECHPKTGELALFWLGQAGFLIKNSKDELLAIDPYLSNAVERICGLKRMMMPVMEQEELNPDYLVISHHDEDHLDMDIIPDVLKRNPATILYGPATVCNKCKEANILKDQVCQFDKGCQYDLGGYKIEAVFADHGDHAPDAIGMLIETEGHMLYFSGDTSFQVDRMAYAAQKDIDILVIPINGEYGNMNSTEGVELVNLVKPKLVIPSHFWTFIRHGSNPYLFDREMRIEASSVPFYFMCQGERILWDGDIVSAVY
ncbi:MAG: MBL fold metallo-hydrolase [Lachnospiraceae bacterium]|nr:MBL fold metallo-hydrolase [Lachnospiraceae bacterium]